MASRSTPSRLPPRRAARTPSSIRRGDLAGVARRGPASDVRIRERRLALRHELLERLVDARIDGRRLVVAEHPLPDRVGPLCGIERARFLPLLEGVVVGGLGSIE